MSAAGDGGVFISYRRGESRHVAGRLADRLIDRFCAERIFMDVQAIEPGTDFAHAIFRAFKRSMSGMRVSVPMPGGWPKRSSRSWPRRLPPLPGVRPGCPAHIRERESTCVDQCGGPGKGRRLLGDMPIAQSTPVEGIDRTLTGLLSVSAGDLAP
jgi:hypothetical protein